MNCYITAVKLIHEQTTRTLISYDSCYHLFQKLVCVFHFAIQKYKDENT